MKNFQPLRRLALLAAVITAPLLAIAQPTPLPSPLHIIVGYPPGGSTDRAARMLAQALQAKRGLTVIVDNKPGAGGRVAAQLLKRSDKGDNVLMLANPAVITVAPLVFKDVGYDPESDFAPVSEIMRYQFAIAVNPTVPAQDMAQLITWLKANPKQAFVGVPATGSLPHFFALMLGDRAGVKTEVVGYKGSAPLTTELVGGQVLVAVDTLDTLMPLASGGKLKIVAISGEQRVPFAPGVKTLKESGLDMAAFGWNALFASKAMPEDKQRAYAAAVQEAMADPALQKQFIDAGMEPVATSAADTAKMLKAYKAQWATAVKNSGYQE